MAPYARSWSEFTLDCKRKYPYRHAYHWTERFVRLLISDKLSPPSGIARLLTSSRCRTSLQATCKTVIFGAPCTTSNGLPTLTARPVVGLPAWLAPCGWPSRRWSSSCPGPPRVYARGPEPLPRPWRPSWGACQRASWRAPCSWAPSARGSASEPRAAQRWRSRSGGFAPRR